MRENMRWLSFWALHKGTGDQIQISTPLTGWASSLHYSHSYNHESPPIIFILLFFSFIFSVSTGVNQWFLLQSLWTCSVVIIYHKNQATVFPLTFLSVPQLPAKLYYLPAFTFSLESKLGKITNSTGRFLATLGSLLNSRQVGICSQDHTRITVTHVLSVYLDFTLSHYSQDF